MWSAFTTDGAMVETCLLLYNALFHVSDIQYMARWNYTESVFLNADPHPILKQKYKNEKNILGPLIILDDRCSKRTSSIITG